MKNVPNYPKILVIENDPDHIYILEEIFKEQGYDWRIYKEVPDIHSLVNEYEPSLVLLDYMLPCVNGGELCSQLKSENDTKDIPVVIYSASPKAFLSLGTYGCDLFIPKPFDLYDFIDKINSLIRTRSIA